MLLYPVIIYLCSDYTLYMQLEHTETIPTEKGVQGVHAHAVNEQHLSRQTALRQSKFWLYL